MCIWQQSFSQIFKVHMNKKTFITAHHQQQYCEISFKRAEKNANLTTKSHWREIVSKPMVLTSQLANSCQQQYQLLSAQCN